MERSATVEDSDRLPVARFIISDKNKYKGYVMLNFKTHYEVHNDAIKRQQHHYRKPKKGKKGKYLIVSIILHKLDLKYKSLKEDKSNYQKQISDTSEFQAQEDELWISILRKIKLSIDFTVVAEWCFVVFHTA